MTTRYVVDITECFLANMETGETIGELVSVDGLNGVLNVQTFDVHTKITGLRRPAVRIGMGELARVTYRLPAGSWELIV